MIILFASSILRLALQTRKSCTITFWKYQRKNRGSTPLRSMM